MESFVDSLVVIFGFFLRLGVPILITMGLAIFLRRLDQRWQVEAEREHVLDLLTHAEMEGTLPSPEACWEIVGCSPEARGGCTAYLSKEKYCWDCNRIEGKVADQCLTCNVLKSALPIKIKA